MGIDWDANAPDLVIASGRKAVPVALTLSSQRKLGSIDITQKDSSLRWNDKPFVCFIQNPKIKSDYFDLVAAPLHDDVKGDNVISTHAAPTRITDDILKKAKAEFDYSHLPDKKIAILIGGNSKTHSMAPDFAKNLFNLLMPAMRSGEYGFLITISRRTPPSIVDELQNYFNDENCVIWDGEGKNPYHAYLAHADFILVTEDSTSMLSDALTTGKPTYRLAMQGESKKFMRLYQNLKRRCGLTVFDGELKAWDYKPLNDAKKIADAINRQLNKRDYKL
jgi:mitochondrial fission protein ELM1